MIFDIVTIFPEFFQRRFGAGEGSAPKPEPLFAAVESVLSDQTLEKRAQTAIVLLSAQGKLLNHSVAQALAEQKRLVLLCGRYEGVDERVAAHLATLELSIGDYVLTGGELAAAGVVGGVTGVRAEGGGDGR